MQNHDVIIQEIVPEKTYTLRHELLQSHQTLKACVYPGDFESDTVHLGAFFDGEQVGILSLYKEPLETDTLSNENAWRIRGLGILEKYRYQGIAKALMSRAIERAKAQQAELVWGNVRTYAKGFYASCGFKKLGEEFDVVDIGPHIVMIYTV